MSDREFDNLPEAVEFIQNNCVLPPKKIPGKDEIVFEAKPGQGVDMFDLEAAIARVGASPKRNPDQDVSVTGSENLKSVANLRHLNSRASADFNFTGSDGYRTLSVAK